MQQEATFIHSSWSTSLHLSVNSVRGVYIYGLDRIKRAGAITLDIECIYVYAVYKYISVYILYNGLQVHCICKLILNKDIHTTYDIFTTFLQPFLSCASSCSCYTASGLFTESFAVVAATTLTRRGEGCQSRRSAMGCGADSGLRM